MNGNGQRHGIIQATSKTDAIVTAVRLELERWRSVIESDPGLQSVVVTVHLAAGYGHPRSIECGLKSEKRLQVPLAP